MSLRAAQGMVKEFHEAMGVTTGKTPAVRDPALRWSLLREECGETGMALNKRDLPGIADGLCDLIYVALGTAVACGIDLAPIFEEVHRANMAKTGGGMREDGKILKPPGWTPPDVEGLLRAQGWKP